MSEAGPHHTSSGPRRRAAVVTGGEALHPDVLGLLDHADLVVAADSGLDRLWDLGRLPDLVVGDLDSVTPTALATARHHDVPVDAHPTDKDATDTELAILAALERDCASVTVVSGGGDRLDHLLGWLSVLSSPALAHLAHLDAWCGSTHVHVLHGPRTHQWTGDAPGDVVSLLPWGGDCHGVTTHGLRWSLVDASLSASSSRGVSNEIVLDTATVSLTTGVLAVVRPHRRITPLSIISPTPSGGPHDQ